MKKINLAVMCLMMAQCIGISGHGSLRNQDGSINLNELQKREDARKNLHLLQKVTNADSGHWSFRNEDGSINFEKLQSREDARKAHQEKFDENNHLQYLEQKVTNADNEANFYSDQMDQATTTERAALNMKCTEQLNQIKSLHKKIEQHTKEINDQALQKFKWVDTCSRFITFFWVVSMTHNPKF